VCVCARFTWRRELTNRENNQPATPAIGCFLRCVSYSTFKHSHRADGGAATVLPAGHLIGPRLSADGGQTPLRFNSSFPDRNSIGGGEEQSRRFRPTRVPDRPYVRGVQAERMADIRQCALAPEGRRQQRPFESWSAEQCHSGSSSNGHASSRPMLRVRMIDHGSRSHRQIAAEH
jgi:hypothetical protein